jgi:protein-disulfide isomerase
MARGARARGPARTRVSHALVLLCVLGSVACERPGQAGAQSGQIDATSPGGPQWPGFGSEDEPKLTDADVEKVATKLPHQKVPAVSAQNPAKGPPSAKVTLQVFSDFECPFCVRVAPTLEDLAQRYEGKLRIVWRNYPLPMHARARPAARAALSAFAQGGSPAFWKMHDWLYSPSADLSDAGLSKAATKLSLDPAKLTEAVQGPRYDAIIDADIAAANAAGIEGTPAAFINDYYLMGARFESEYAIVVERALREAR